MSITTNYNSNQINLQNLNMSNSVIINSAPLSKPLEKFVIIDNFPVHPAHQIEEGIFQHNNKLPAKKKENLTNLGVSFSCSMNDNEKAIVVNNFERFVGEYAIADHRPFLALNQSGMLKPEQIKFARYLGQGLPNFTLFCIYSNFKNLFCLKRFENYSKDNYDLKYILEKTRSYLSSTTAELKAQNKLKNGEQSMPTMHKPKMKQSIDLSIHAVAHQQPQLLQQHPLLQQHQQQQHQHMQPQQHLHSHQQLSTVTKQEIAPKVLENLQIHENFDVHESHRIEGGIFTHIGRLSPKKQEILKQFGIQSNHSVTYYEKHVILENFMKFCNIYKIVDHRPFLDLNESGFPKMEQIKFARFLGQSLPKLALYKIYSIFKDILAMNRMEKLLVDGYDLQAILKKKKRKLYARVQSAASREAQAAKQLQTQSDQAQQQQQQHVPQQNQQTQPFVQQPEQPQQQTHQLHQQIILQHPPIQQHIQVPQYSQLQNIQQQSTQHFSHVMQQQQQQIQSNPNEIIIYKM